MNILLYLILISFKLWLNYNNVVQSHFIRSIPNFNLEFFGKKFELTSEAFVSLLSSSSWIVNSTKSHMNVVSKKLRHNTYDFIVVGAGAAGSVVASRLSENPEFKVLLVEAGGPENLMSDTPGMYEKLRGSQFDWAFVSEPQSTSAFNFIGNRVLMPRGKAMGGSTAINGMFYTRGAAKGYDEWAAIGLHGWSFKEVLPFFLRSERNTDPKFLVNTKYHNNSGPLPINSHMIKSQNKYGPLLVNACKELGFPEIDINGFYDIGTNIAQQNIDNGLRVSASKAFLEPIINDRENLDVLDNAMVTRVLFSSNKRAIGVVIDYLGFNITIKARKEIIISAGAIGSPHLLLVSGIGSRTQLRKFDIPLVADLPGVGENFQDHVYVIGPSFTLPSNGTVPTLSIEAFLEYKSNRVGPLAFLDQSICEANSTFNHDINWSDIQINAIDSFNTINPLTAIKDVGFKLNVWNKMYKPYVGRTAFALRAVAMRPKSRGRVILKSRDIFIPPIIEPNYYSNAEDIKVIIEGLRWTYRVAHTKAFKQINAKMFSRLVVGCEHKYEMITDDMFNDMTRPNDQYLECVARAMNINGFHMAGTCKMGLKSDRLAVVDNQLRVFGVSGVRVIDASIMPVLVNKNTMAPTIMIGERGVQFIIDSYKP